MRSHSNNVAVWAFVGFFVLCLPTFFYTGYLNLGRRVWPHQRDVQKRYDINTVNVFHSPGHQNPAKAPAVPYDFSASSLVSRSRHGLEKREALRCDTEPCIDGR